MEASQDFDLADLSRVRPDGAQAADLSQSQAGTEHTTQIGLATAADVLPRLRSYVESVERSAKSAQMLQLLV